MNTKFYFLPNKFDNCPLEDALAILEAHGKDFLERLNQRRVDENMSDGTWQDHIRSAADEVYWTRVIQDE